LPEAAVPDDEVAVHEVATHPKRGGRTFTASPLGALDLRGPAALSRTRPTCAPDLFSLAEVDKPSPESAEQILARLLHGSSGAQPLLYQRPGYYTGDERLFHDLLAHAPGLNTTEADVRAVLEAEALPTPASKPGAVTAAARALFARARAAGGQSLALSARGDRPAFTVTLDGADRFAYRRTLPGGLRERVACDGKTLYHLYPDLGLAARRRPSTWSTPAAAGR
jgi:hypothetical protein